MRAAALWASCREEPEKEYYEALSVDSLGHWPVLPRGTQAEQPFRASPAARQHTGALERVRHGSFRGS